MTNPQQYEQTYRDNAVGARSDLTRWLRDDVGDGTSDTDNNVFTGPIWNQNTQLSGADVNDLLNQAAPGLQWFELALVRYHRVWDLLKIPGFDQFVVPPLAGIDNSGETITTIADPRDGEMRRLEGKWYDQQRDMKLDSLRQLAQDLQTASASNGTQPDLVQMTQDIGGVAAAVPEVWQGQSGSAAQDHIAGFHAHASQTSQYVQAMASALNGLPDVLLNIVKDKADFIVQFNSDQMPVAGHAMKLDGASDDPVSMIIGTANGSQTGPQSDDVIQSQFHSTATDLTDQEQICKDWLTKHFGPAVREAFTAFIHQCALADHYIKQAYQPVMTLLSNQDPAEFPKLGNSDPDGNQQPSPGSVTPSSTTTAGVGANTPTTAQQNPTATTPSSVNPASTQNNPQSSLSGLLSQGQQAAQTLQSGAGQLSGMLQSGVSQAQSALQTGLSGLTGNGTAASAISNTLGSKTLANFSLGGQNLSVTQASDGTVTTTVTGPDGKPQQFSMGIRNGVPFFTPGGDPAAKIPGAHHDSTSHGGGASVGGGGGSSPAMVTGGSAPSDGAAGAGGAHPGSSVPGTPSATTGNTALSPGTSSAPGTSTGSPIGGMPHAGGGGGGGGKGSDGEHKSSGVVQARPMWKTGPDRNPLIDGAGAQLPMAGSFADDTDTAGTHYEPNIPYEPNVEQPSPHAQPEVPAPAPAPAAAPPAAAPRTDGVKIEIDMGNAK